jgi:hypothetical protein
MALVKREARIQAETSYAYTKKAYDKIGKPYELIGMFEENAYTYSTDRQLYTPASYNEYSTWSEDEIVVYGTPTTLSSKTQYYTYDETDAEEKSSKYQH